MRMIDGKYQTSGDLTKLDGTPIPVDEPLILFRGKDELLPALLEHYKQLCQDAGSPPEQLDRVDERIKAVRTWQEENRATVHVPD